MQTKEITVINKLGLHARATTKLVQMANRFGAKITLDNGSKTADAKSIMGVLMLAGKQGTTLTLTCEGEDELEAMEAISGLFADYFGEGE